MLLFSWEDSLFSQCALWDTEKMLWSKSASVLEENNLKRVTDIFLFIINVIIIINSTCFSKIF